MGRVVRYRSDEDLYEVADADDDRKVFELGATRVIPLTDTGRGVPPAHVLCGAQSCLVDAHDEANRLQKGNKLCGSQNLTAHYRVYLRAIDAFLHDGVAVLVSPARRSSTAESPPRMNLRRIIECARLVDSTQATRSSAFIRIRRPSTSASSRSRRGARARRAARATASSRTMRMRRASRRTGPCR